MKTNIKNISLLMLAMLLSIASFAQVESTINQGYYTFGINGGWAYQQSDICADDGGFGVGLTLGKNLYYQPGAPLSFDLRGRLMYAQMLGLNHERTLAIDQNTAVNGADNENPDYLNYPAEFNVNEPFVYENNQTHLGELGLEGVITLNKLRENTGVIASVFGGVGLDYYNTFTDQRNGFQGGEYYDLYAGIDANSTKANTLRTLRNGLDGNYETNANGIGEAGKLTWMPSLGIELGYELTPTWAIKAGHKATWARDNTIDGSQWSDNQNDLWHYTSIGMEWKIRAGKSARAPQVKITVPQQDPYTTYDPAGFVRANIKNVNSSADVTCTVNGQQVPFDFYNENFSASFPLRMGQNKVVVRATNIAGDDSDSVLIILKKDNGGSTGPPVVTSPNNGNPNNGNPNNGPRPVVDFTNPPRDNYRVQAERFVVRADVKNVQYRKDIRLIVNNRETTNFSFDANRNLFVATIALNRGNNGVKIIATNRSGTDSEERRVIFGNNNPPPPNIAKPIVDIVDPYGNSHQTQQSSAALRATVKNVDRKSDIEVTVNGQRVSNFSFSGVNVSANVSLREGNNTIVVKGTNSGGYDSDQVKVVYKRPVVNKNPPVVTFRKPTKTTTVNTPTTPIEVSIKNVNNKNDIIFKVNNQRVYDFTFSGGTLRKTIQVSSGNNPVYVKATNQDGSDDASVTIRYIRPVSLPKPPTVNITKSTGTVYSSTSKTTTVKATIKNVPSKNNVSFKVNNQARNFSYNSANGTLTATVTLTEGNNNVVIKATNNDGTADDRVSIRYAVPAVKLPTVTITKPANNAVVTKPITTVKATIKNVPSRNGVTLKVNGVKKTNFTYTNGVMTATVTLKIGSNTIFVEGVNSDGKASEIAKVTYKKPKPEPKPTVVFTNPAKKGTVTQKKAFIIKATVKNVKTKSDVALTVNGRKASITSFNAKAGTLTANIQLRTGKNSFKITGMNGVGSASASSDITLKTTVTPATPKPRVTINSVSSPVIDPLNPTQARSTVLAKIENIQNSNQITFKVNGKVLTNYSYNAKSGAFQALINLKQGENKVQITANTRAGSDTKSKTVTL